MIKAILGFDVESGMTPEEYEQWLFEVHAPDLLANPHLDRLVFNKVLRPVTRTSGGAAQVPDGKTLYRITELHYADEAAYAAAQAWFAEHPIPAERGPAGRTKFDFYVLTDSMEMTRPS
jgi:hypothetical protein